MSSAENSAAEELSSSTVQHSKHMNRRAAPGGSSQPDQGALLTREEVAALREQGKQEGWTFRVGVNPATESSAEHLCGVVKPEDWVEEPVLRDPEPISRDLPAYRVRSDHLIYPGRLDQAEADQHRSGTEIFPSRLDVIGFHGLRIRSDVWAYRNHESLCT